jgi:hypothetical protein
VVVPAFESLVVPSPAGGVVLSADAVLLEVPWTSVLPVPLVPDSSEQARARRRRAETLNRWINAM